MPPSDTQRAMMRLVLSTFSETGNATLRDDILRKYPESDDLNDIVWRTNIFRVFQVAGTEEYLPTVWVYHFAGDEEKEEFARKSVQTLVKILLAQFFAKRDDLSRPTLLKEARAIDPNADDSSIELGINLCCEMFLLQCSGGTPQQPLREPTKAFFDQILRYKDDPDKCWDEFTSTYKWYDNRAQKIEEIYFSEGAGEALADELQGTEHPPDSVLESPNSDQVEKEWPRADKLSVIMIVVAVAALIVAIIGVIVVLPRAQRWLDAPAVQSTVNSSSPAASPSVDTPPKTQGTDTTHDDVTAEVSPAAPQQQGRVDWHDQASWRANLKEGMTENQVRELFGNPDHVSETSDMDQWEYGEGFAGGTIWFADGKLWSWNEPDRK